MDSVSYGRGTPVHQPLDRKVSLAARRRSFSTALADTSPATRNLAHKKQPSFLGPPYGSRHRPTVESYGNAVSYERGTTVHRPLNRKLSLPVRRRSFSNALADTSPATRYLAHKKAPPPPGPPYGSRHSPTVRSYGEASEVVFDRTSRFVTAADGVLFRANGDGFLPKNLPDSF